MCSSDVAARPMTSRFVAPRNAGGKLDDREAGPADGALGLVGAVGQGDPVSEVRRDDRLPGVHRVHIVHGDKPLGHEQRADPVDGFVLASSRGPHLDGGGRQDLGGHAWAASSDIG